jgi:hypothetical protein
MAFDDGGEGLAWAGWQRRRSWSRCRACRRRPWELGISSVAADSSTTVTWYPCRLAAGTSTRCLPRRLALWRESRQQAAQHGGPTPPAPGDAAGSATATYGNWPRRRRRTGGPPPRRWSPPRLACVPSGRAGGQAGQFGAVALALSHFCSILPKCQTATSSGWALYVGNFRIPKYWE